MQLFQQLGDQVEAAWSAENYDESIFPSIAEAALSLADIPSKMSAWDVLKWTLEQTELPRQKDPRGNFGEPPITLYIAPRFYIDLYVWLEGTTAVHQHSFCGAFQVLQGSSIHSWYEFESTHRVNAFLDTGRMSLKTCELLQVGDVQQILPGRQYIHSLFHLDQPSATICVRTDRSPLEMPQFAYHKPSLAIDPFFEHETSTKKLQTIAAFYRAKHADADNLVIELIERSDLQTTFRILETASTWLGSNQLDQKFNAKGGQDRFEEVLAAVDRRHGELSRVLRDVFASTSRGMEIIKRRNFISDPEHRFFLALLLNIDSREPIFSLIRERYPEVDPTEKILDWTFELSETRVLGTVNENALGIPDFDNLDMIVLEALIKGQSESEARQEIESEGNAANPDLLSQLPARFEKIRNAAIFKPLFVE